MLLPVEKMAVRVLRLHGLEPPFDLRSLAQRYASVEYLSFPVSADGVTIGLGSSGRPQILINADKPTTRQRFTLAHELGHVVIPWHTGTIVSHLEVSEEDDFEYREMESEANKFASELLMPTDWISSRFKWNESFGGSLSRALADAGTSRDAFLIKLFRVINFPVLCAQVDDAGGVVRQYSCGPVGAGGDMQDLDELDEHFSGLPVSREEFDLGDRGYVAWIFQPLKIAETDARSWRDILTVILDETSLQSSLGSINAILPVQVNRNSEKSIDEICSLVVASYSKRPQLARFVNHRLFSQYVVKRVTELRERFKA